MVPADHTCETLRKPCGYRSLARISNLCHEPTTRSAGALAVHGLTFGLTSEYFGTFVFYPALTGIFGNMSPVWRVGARGPFQGWCSITTAL